MSLAVDPAMQPILERLRAARMVDLRTLPIAEARQALYSNDKWNGRGRRGGRRRCMTLRCPGAAGPLRARLYLPATGAPLPVTLYAHGGGWTFGDIDTHDGVMRMLATQSGAAVLGFDYRLAPEHPYPAPLDDCLAVLAHVEKGGLGEAIDRRRIALAGDSAGANLALGVLIKRRDDRGAMPKTAALFYGCYAPIYDTDSNTRCGDGSFLLGTDMMRWFWNNYLGPTAAKDAPAACAPLHADHTGLPPLYLNAAGLDPLLDDTTMLSARLASAGVRHTLDIWPGVVHGFLRFARDLPAARHAITAGAHHLGAALGTREA